MKQPRERKARQTITRHQSRCEERGYLDNLEDSYHLPSEKEKTQRRKHTEADEERPEKKRQMKRKRERDRNKRQMKRSSPVMPTQSSLDGD